MRQVFFAPFSLPGLETYVGSSVTTEQLRQRDLWLTRLYYFVCLGGTGFIAPFLNLFYVRVGLSGTDIGVVAAIGCCVAAPSEAPHWPQRVTLPRFQPNEWPHCAQWLMSWHS